MTRSLSTILISALTLGLSAGAAQSAPVAEQVTALNAATRLFGGSDADGGIDDYYLSNGVVELIIDDVGPQADLVPLVGPLAPDKVSEFAFTGCSIIDLGLAGADNDQLSQIFTVGGLSTANFILYDSISTSSTLTSATITCTGTLLGFPPISPSDLGIVTEITVSDSDAFATMTTTVTNTSGINATSLGGFLDVSIWTLRAQVPFTPSTDRGFRHSVLNLSNPIPSIEVPPFSAAPGVLGPADGMVDTVTATPSGETSYGLLGVSLAKDPDAGGPTLPTTTPVDLLFGVSTNLLTALGNPPSSPVNAGSSLTYVRRLYVGGKNDVAAVSNLMLPEIATRQGFSTGTISGNVDATDASDIQASIIARAVGTPPGFAVQPNSPITQIRTDSTGVFSGVVLPAGTYNLEIQSPERDPITVGAVVVTASTNTAVTIPALSAVGTVNLTVTEQVPGVPDTLIPARVTFIGIDGTPNPRFSKFIDAISFSGVTNTDLLAETFGGGAAQKNFAYLTDGTGVVQLQPGKYEVYATHGPEYTLKRKKIRVKEGGVRNVRLRLKRVTNVPGISADFHIHSGRSQDTQAGLRDRVISFVGEQVEVMVSTDHEFHVDYAPLITSLGLGSLVTSIVGNEVTGSVPNPPVFPDSIGHINAWPLSVDPTARRDGAIEDEFVAPNFLYKRLRDQGADVIQYNHVRAGVAGVTSIGFFNNFGYDPDLPLTSPPNDLLLDDDVLGPGISGVANPMGLRNIDFDAMEIQNGTGISDFIALRRDWFSLLNQTDFSTVPFIKGTGVSDSHRVTLETAGYARTYVRGAGEDPSSLNVATFNSQVLAGDMWATTGPLVTFSISDVNAATADLGETFVPATSTVVLNIEVTAAPWINVQEVRVIRNGFNVVTFDNSTNPKVREAPKKPWSAHTGQRCIRFSAEVPLTLANDGYFVVEAGDKLSPVPTADPFVNQIVPGLIPVAFTNPIFVDLAGDGFDPPGLPVMAKATVKESEIPMFARVERHDDTVLARLRTWIGSMLASIVSTKSAVAHEDRKTALTGRERAAEVEAQKDQATDEYFPLHRFQITPEAADQAIEQLPEPLRSKARAQQQKGN